MAIGSRISSTRAPRRGWSSTGSGKRHPARSRPRCRYARSLENAWSPSAMRSSRDRTTRSNATYPRSSSCAPARSAFGPAPDRRRVLRRGRRELPHRDGQIHGPPHADDLLGEEDVALRVPVGVAKALQIGQPEVVRDDTGHLPVPGPFGGRLLELLVDRAEEGEPDRGADEIEEILHARIAGAGVVPGFTSGTPCAHCGHSSG